MAQHNQQLSVELIGGFKTEFVLAACSGYGRTKSLRVELTYDADGTATMRHFVNRNDDIVNNAPEKVGPFLSLVAAIEVYNNS